MLIIVQPLFLVTRFDPSGSAALDDIASLVCLRIGVDGHTAARDAVLTGASLVEGFEDQRP